MTLKNLISILIISLFITACAGLTTTPPIVVTENPPEPTAKAGELTPYPAPIVVVPLPTFSTYPGPGTPSPGIPSIPPSGYEPQPGDDKLKRDEVLLDITNSRLDIKEGYPVQVSAILKGNLSDPCHQLRVVVTPPDENNVINLEAYSVVDPAAICTTVLEPIDATIPLGSYTSGEIQVYVNGEMLGEFGIGYQPQPGDEKLTRDQVFLELENSQLVATVTKPVQVNAILRGNLSDPCHQLRVVVNAPDENNAINLEVYSLVEKGINCITVLKPFQAIIPMGNFSSGHYSVYVNGEPLGEFDG